MEKYVMYLLVKKISNRFKIQNLIVLIKKNLFDN